MRDHPNFEAASHRLNVRFWTSPSFGAAKLQVMIFTIAQPQLGIDLER